MLKIIKNLNLGHILVKLNNIIKRLAYTIAWELGI